MLVKIVRCNQKHFVNYVHVCINFHCFVWSFPTVDCSNKLASSSETRIITSNIAQLKNVVFTTYTIASSSFSLSSWVHSCLSLPINLFFSISLMTWVSSNGFYTYYYTFILLAKCLVATRILNGAQKWEKFYHIYQFMNYMQLFSRCILEYVCL